MDLTVEETPTVEIGRQRSNLLFGAATVIVAMNLLAAFLLGRAADTSRVTLAAAVFVGLALLINIGRFLLWRTLHRRYRFVDVMPLTALFYPLVAAVSWLQGETMSRASVGGIAMVTFGAWAITREVDDDA